MTSRAGPWCWTQVSIFHTANLFCHRIKDFTNKRTIATFPFLTSRWPPQEEESPNLQAPNPRDVSLSGLQCVYNRHLSRSQSMLNLTLLSFFDIRTRSVERQQWTVCCFTSLSVCRVISSRCLTLPPVPCVAPSNCSVSSTHPGRSPSVWIHTAA